MSTDLTFLNIFHQLAEFGFIFLAVAIITLDWYHSFLEKALLFLRSYLPQWKHKITRQNLYLCLLGYGLTIMFANSLKDLPSNTLNGIVAASSSVHVVLLSFSRQSKVGPENASDQSATHPQDRLSRIHSLLLPITEDDEPQSEVNIEEELRSDYVKGYRKIYDERKVPEEKLVAAIKYLNRLKGG